MPRDLLAEEATASRLRLRPHQERAIALVKQSLGRGNRRVILQAAVGFGKTLVSARIIEGALAKGNRVIFTAPMVTLINQTVDRLANEGIHDVGVMQANHPLTNPMAAVQVASAQTLARREVPPAALIIVDEAHVRSAVVERLMAERPDVFFVGLSATPWSKGLGLHWQDVVQPITMRELIEQGYLSQYRALAPDVPDLTGVRTVAGDYAEDALAKVMGEAQLMGHAVETWLEHGEDRPTLVFCVNRAHAADMHAAFMRAGVASAYVDGETDSVERRLIFRQFERGEVRVICSVRTMTTGVDLAVSCIVDAAPTKSEMLHVQKLGRGMRVNPGTEDLVILDHAGNLLRLGMPDEIVHTTLDATDKGKQQTRAKAERLPKPCSGCGNLFTGRVCPACGHERIPQAGVETADGRLVEIGGGGSKRKHTMADKQAWYSALLTIRRERGRSSGWVSHTYRDKFGVWPRGMDEVAGPAPQEVRNFVTAKDIAFAKRRRPHNVA